MTSSGQRPGGFPDPMQFWRDFYQQSEAAWGKALEQNMGTEAFAAMIGQTLDAYVTFQKSLRDSMNRYLETMNLPSREDFSRLAAQVVALEAKIDALDEKLDDLQDQLGQRGRTLDGLREALREQDDKLDVLLEQLGAGQRRAASTTPRRRAGGRR